MTRPLVSVVMSTYERAHLLARSLIGYERSEGINVQADLELVVVNDGSTDGTDELVKRWSHRTGIRAVALTPHPKKESWRDCGVTLNTGIRASSGHHVLLTHPEVIPGKKSINACVAQLQAFDDGRNGRRLYDERNECYNTGPLGLYACCPVYYLSTRDQERIDTVPWREGGNLALRKIEGFYDDEGGNIDYSHAATDIVAQPGSRLPQWESLVFGGFSRETWKRLGGLQETRRWGSIDVLLLARRRALGIPTHTTPDPGTIVVHQNHNMPGDVETPRDMDVWVRELKDFPTNDPSKLVYPEVDNLGW